MSATAPTSPASSSPASSGPAPSNAAPSGPAPNGTAPATRRRILHRGSTGMLVAGALLVVGSALPWVMTPFGTVSGLAGPGLWTLSAGFLVIAGALLPFRVLAIAHCLVPGIGVATLVAWQVARLVQLSAATGEWGQMLPGMGLVMVAGGAVVVLRTGYRLVVAT